MRITWKESENRREKETGDALLTRVKNKQVMPFDTSILQDDSTAVDYSQSAKGIVKIVSDTPYARRLYFHPEYNFSRKENIAAGGKWFSPWLEGAHSFPFQLLSLGLISQKRV